MNLLKRLLKPIFDYIVGKDQYWVDRSSWRFEKAGKNYYNAYMIKK